jgi:hypothetical protein
LIQELWNAGVEHPGTMFPVVREHTDGYLTMVMQVEQIDRMRQLLVDTENQQQWNTVTP